MIIFRFILFFLLFIPNVLLSQNRTANTRRKNIQANDTLTQRQIRVFSKMLENMVFVDGGTFIMGTDNNYYHQNHDNTPAHLVEISPFFICKYEVTQDEWELVTGANPSTFIGTNLPVENISWDDCRVFINKLNEMTGMDFRLPSEAEWEYAALGGKYSLHYKYAGSEYPKSVAWYADNSKSRTHQVGKKRPNELGIYDMSGNVSEWCGDYYEYSYYQHSPSLNPIGPDKGLNRVVRGGGWMMNENYIDIKYRAVYPPNEKNSSIGIRLAM